MPGLKFLPLQWHFVLLFSLTQVDESFFLFSFFFITRACGSSRICRKKPAAIIFHINQRWLAAQCTADPVNCGGPLGCRQVLCWSKAARARWTFVPPCQPSPFSSLRSLTFCAPSEDAAECVLSKSNSTFICSKTVRPQRAGDDVERNKTCLPTQDI